MRIYATLWMTSSIHMTSLAAVKAAADGHASVGSLLPSLQDCCYFSISGTEHINTGLLPCLSHEQTRAALSCECLSKMFTSIFWHLWKNNDTSDRPCENVQRRRNRQGTLQLRPFPHLYLRPCLHARDYRCNTGLCYASSRPPLQQAFLVGLASNLQQWQFQGVHATAADDWHAHAGCQKPIASLWTGMSLRLR